MATGELSKSEVPSGGSDLSFLHPEDMARALAHRERLSTLPPHEDNEALRPRNILRPDPHRFAIAKTGGSLAVGGEAGQRPHKRSN